MNVSFVYIDDLLIMKKLYFILRRKLVWQELKRIKK